MEFMVARQHTDVLANVEVFRANRAAQVLIPLAVAVGGTCTSSPTGNGGGLGFMNVRDYTMLLQAWSGGLGWGLRYGRQVMG